MGIRREDKFKKITLWGSLERILMDTDDHIAESPFESERIIEVLRAVFMGLKFHGYKRHSRSFHPLIRDYIRKENF